MIDYGSESLRRYQKLNHTGGIIYAGEEEKFKNLFKMIEEEFKIRKEMFSDYNGSYETYIEQSGKKLPLFVVIFNN